MAGRVMLNPWLYGKSGSNPVPSTADYWVDVARRTGEGLGRHGKSADFRILERKLGRRPTRREEAAFELAWYGHQRIEPFRVKRNPSRKWRKMYKGAEQEEYLRGYQLGVQAEKEGKLSPAPWNLKRAEAAGWRMAFVDAAKRGRSGGFNPRGRRAAYSADPFAHHQIEIARRTLLMPDAMVGVMGGPTKEEAREILERFRAKGYGKQSKRRSAKNPWGGQDVHSFHMGPSQVGQFAKRFRDAGIPVDVEGVEKVWIKSPKKREELLEQYRQHHGRTHGLRNPGWLYPESGAGSKTVEFIDRFGERRKGKIVMRSSQPGYWVLNMGGRHGTPAVIHESEIISGGPAMRKNSSRRSPRGTRKYRRNSPLTVYVGKHRHTRKAMIKRYGPKRAAKLWRKARTKYHGYGKFSATCRTVRHRRKNRR